eukprot:1425131-Karenia_brevis.AAC.1
MAVGIEHTLGHRWKRQELSKVQSETFLCAQGMVPTICTTATTGKHEQTTTREPAAQAKIGATTGQHASGMDVPSLPITTQQP